MMNQKDVLRLGQLPESVEMKEMNVEDAFDSAARKKFQEMAVLLDPEKPESVLGHPVLGPILSTQGRAIFVVDQDGKTKLRAPVVAVQPLRQERDQHENISMLHLVLGGKIEGTTGTDNFAVPESWRDAGAALKDVVAGIVQSAERDGMPDGALGVYSVDQRLSRLATSDLAKAAMRGLARGMGNATYNEKLFKGNKEGVYTDGRLPEGREKGQGTPIGISKEVRRALETVYLINDGDTSMQGLVDALQEGDDLSRMQTLIRFLAECPHNLLDCETFVRVLDQLADSVSKNLSAKENPDAEINVQIFGPDNFNVNRIDGNFYPLEDLDLNGLKAVHQGSTNETGPFMVRVTYRHNKAKGQPVHLVVGKAVMQDDGGHCAKGPAAKDMQADMTGGAALASMLAKIGEDQPEANIDLVWGIVSNTADGNAFRVNDIIKLSSGRTMAVENTDAEGRIVLADCGGAALRLLAKKDEKVGKVTTVSTLTGHAVVVGGHRVVVNSTSRGLLREIEDLGTAAGEGFQGIQLDPKDFELLGKDTRADLRNLVKLPVGPVSARGTCTGAAFIAEGMGLSPDKRNDFVQFDIAPSLELGKLGPKDTAGWEGLPTGNFVDTLYKYVTG